MRFLFFVIGRKYMEVKIHIYFIRWNTVSRKVANILIILFTDDFKNFQDCQSLKKGENEKEIIHLKVILKKNFLLICLCICKYN